MKIIVNGSNGRMGKEVVRLALDGYREAELVAAVDINNSPSAKYPLFEKLADYEGNADCIIDFSFHGAAKEVTDYAVMRKLPVVIATTGQSEGELRIIEKAAEKVPVFMSANMSLGIALLAELARAAVRMMPDADVEIIEKHHNRKLDAPSGTALLIANEIKRERSDAEYVYGRCGHHKREHSEIGIHAVRMGNIVGEHEILIGTDTQTITLKHEAHDRSLFAEGAVAAAQFLLGKPAGMYSMKDIING